MSRLAWHVARWSFLARRRCWRLEHQVGEIVGDFDLNLGPSFDRAQRADLIAIAE